ncbi:serine dehydratase alpha chain [Rhizoclosmatium globosum]|uniref:Serine dehydratase alpha chain n=1 Tax=Rhizoclosmatium globosum TaxID=329046 RepID=A0A1Y2CQM3_9FUNG|nr:serine dehydratase alpha chain [Rhizoclosmatium globosum]|eukprot:ORY49338.1 serine dehydratase alpha chain [Rhizoclosmatium globosum]
MEALPQHPNGMRITCYDKEGDMIGTNEFFSVGGGFVINDLMRVIPKFLKTAPKPTTVKPIKHKDDHLTSMIPFSDAQSLLAVCQRENMSIAEVVFRNELQWREQEEVKRRTLAIWTVMDQSIANGISNRTNFFQETQVKRQYAGMNLSPKSQLSSGSNRTLISDALKDPKPPKTSELTLAYKDLSRIPKEMKKHLPALDWISMYALAVNEENAAGGRVVTAPTNGAAGTIPAVLKYYLEFICPSPEHAERDILEFLFTAAAIGMLYKRGASISAAEMGCQGEVGVACSMAAAAFTAVMGGTVEQVENAAEIGMEHNLGLTWIHQRDSSLFHASREMRCCCEGITAAQLALNGDGTHRVHLDQVIATMRQTGIDMMSKYKETSQGGLAVNVPVC